MTEFLSIAALWMGMALFSSLLTRWLKIATAVVEILVGVAAAAIAEELGGREILGFNEPWLVYLSSLGALMLAFLAGAELEPATIRSSWKKVLLLGLASFAAPLFGCCLIAWISGWSVQASWLCGVALSSVSMVIVYSVTLEHGFNKIEFGKAILGACFVANFCTSLAMGFFFSPVSYRSLLLLGSCLLILPLLPMIMRILLARHRRNTAEVETKWILLLLFGLGALASWAGSEPVLIAYLAGLAAASTVGRNQVYRARLQTLVMGLLTPFFFIRAGTFLSISALSHVVGWALVMFAALMLIRVGSLFPLLGCFYRNRRERAYFSLLMSTGLTFGIICALFGFSNHIINQEQYSLLIAVIIGSAVLPTVVANGFFLPHHLLRFGDDRSNLPKQPIHRDTGRWYT